MNKETQKYQFIDNRFYIDRENKLGEGAFGKVFRAYDADNPNNQICVKVIDLEKFSQNEKEILYKEKRELESLIALQNDYIPNIVKLIHQYITKRTIYIFIEFCNGGTLRELLDQRKILTEAEVIIILKQLATAFHLLNQRNLIHRDVKPANILIHNDIIYKISDFGFSRYLTDMHKSILLSCVGTPLYMAPELLLMQKSIEGKCDIWSLGIVGYEMLFGQQPFIADKLERLKEKIAKEEVQFKEIAGLPARSRKIKDLIRGMLQKDQKQRSNWVDVLNHEVFKYNEVVLLKNEQFLNSYLQQTKLTSSLMDQMYNNSTLKIPVDNTFLNQSQFPNILLSKTEQNSISTNSGSQTQEIMGQRNFNFQQKVAIKQLQPKVIEDDDYLEEINNFNFKTTQKIKKQKKSKEGNQEMYRQMKKKQQMQQESNRIINQIQNFIEYKRNCYLFLDQVINLLSTLFSEQKLQITKYIFYQTIQGLLIYGMILMKNLILLLFDTNKPYFVQQQLEWEIFLASGVNNIFIYHIKNEQEQHEQYLKKFLDENEQFLVGYPPMLNDQFKNLLTSNIQEIFKQIVPVILSAIIIQPKSCEQKFLKLGCFLRYILDFENGILSLHNTKQFIPNFYEFYEKLDNQLNGKLITEFFNI